MDRRTLLHRLGRQAAALALAQLFGPARAQGAQGAPARWPAGIGDPFTLGVASGMPRPDSVVIWTRLAPRPHESGGGLPPVPLAVRWELAEDERFSVGLRRGEFLARPEHAHAVHVEVIFDDGTTIRDVLVVNPRPQQPVAAVSAARDRSRREPPRMEDVS